MKHLKIPLLLIGAFLLVVSRGYAQVNSDLRSKREITSDKMQVSHKGNFAVSSVDPKTLVNGWHYIKTGSQIYYVQMNNKVASNIYVSNLQGRGMQRISMRVGSHFSCGDGGCVCSGDLDCNDMFTTNVCGASAVCIGSICICSRK